MTERPFVLGSLPRVSRRSDHSLGRQRHAAAALFDKSIALASSSFGPGTFTCTDVVSPSPPDEADAVWALARTDDERLGFVILDGMTALRIVAATLGLPAPRLLRPLGASERGIVTAAISSALRSCGARAAVALCRKTWAGEHRIRVILSAKFPTNIERIRLDVFPEWLPRLDTGEGEPQWLVEATKRGLDIPFAVQLARTTLTALEWSRARPGDAVTFDGVPAMAFDTQRRGWLVCGLFQAEIRQNANGIIRMVTAFQPSRRSGGAQADDRGAAKADEKEEQNMSNESDPTSLTMLASAPIEIVAELGRLVLRADEVMALRPGAVIPVGHLRKDLVTLRAGDRLWAYGELVDVEGQLGVRLTALPLASDIHNDSDSFSEADTLR